MKSDKQFELLREWIKAIVDEKIERAFSRDSSLEYLRRIDIEKQLLKLVEEMQRYEDNYKRGG